MQTNIFHLIFQAGMVVKLVMLVLLFFSVFSWAIILFKYRYLSVAEKENASFYKSFRKARNAAGLYAISKKYVLSPMSNIFKAVYTDSELRGDEEIRRALKRYEAQEASKLERHLGFLATTGSTTPFIGLFGTVWGIMNSFRGIGAAGAASLAVVAPGIAEALIATAMGLFAAIPAVIAYNYYLSRTRRVIFQLEDFSEEVLGLMKRQEPDG